MKHLLCCKKDKASARVVDGKLILSFPNAVTPVLWQMDLSEAKASALEVQENKKENIYMLALKTPRGEAVNIASFGDRTTAVKGLMAASNALSAAHGHIRPAAAHQDNTPGAVVSGPREKGVGKWGSVALFILLLFILINIWGALGPRATTGSRVSPVTNNSSGESGVPMSADDYLKSR